MADKQEVPAEMINEIEAEHELDERAKDGIALVVNRVLELKNWTIVELAGALGMSPNTIWRWKNKKSSQVGLGPLIQLFNWGKFSMDVCFLLREGDYDTMVSEDIEVLERKLEIALKEKESLLRTVIHLTEKLDEAEAKLSKED